MAFGDMGTLRHMIILSLGSIRNSCDVLVTATYDEIDNGDWSKQQQFYQQLSFHASCNMSSHRPFHRDYFPTKANQHRELRAWGIIINRDSWTALISGYHRHYQASTRSLREPVKNVLADFVR